MKLDDVTTVRRTEDKRRYDDACAAAHGMDLIGERWSMPFRYAFPAEFDLMARLAGMRLEHRWGDWDRSPYTATSRKHVSVWVK